MSASQSLLKISVIQRRNRMLDSDLANLWLIRHCSTVWNSLKREKMTSWFDPWWYFDDYRSLELYFWGFSCNHLTNFSVTESLVEHEFNNTWSWICTLILDWTCTVVLISNLQLKDQEIVLNAFQFSHVNRVEFLVSPAELLVVKSLWNAESLESSYKREL